MLYALPNIYPSDPSLQISAIRGAEISPDTVTQVSDAFAKQNIQVKSVELEKGQILARFLSTEDQLKAREVVDAILGDKFVSALNLAPATPAWLDSIGARANETWLRLTWWCALLNGSGYENRY